MQKTFTISLLAAACFLLACSATSPPAFAAASKLEQSFNDTTFELLSCTLGGDRTATCKMTVRNQYTDKRIEITKSGITVQDNLGNDYPITGGGFGDPSTAPRWSQVAVADSDYVVHVSAANISSRATSIRAVVFPRLLVRSMQGQALGYRDRVVFSHPPMVDTKNAAPAKPAPMRQTSTEVSTTKADEQMPIAVDEWQLVGLWSYDAEDGQQIPSQGFVLLPKPGAGVGQAWLARLELKNHDQLPERQRALWPVQIHIERRTVCADYPGYPSYKVFIDMPGLDNDAIYSVSACKPD